MQNTIISAIDIVISAVIQTEVENTPFILVQADETTDCAVYAQLSVIISYVAGCKNKSKIFRIL